MCPKLHDESFDREKNDRKKKVKKRNESKGKEASKVSTVLTAPKKIQSCA